MSITSSERSPTATLAGPTEPAHRRTARIASAISGPFTLPGAAWELSLGIHLIVDVFKPSAILANR
jgi:hypothetical protein